MMPTLRLMLAFAVLTAACGESREPESDAPAETAAPVGSEAPDEHGHSEEEEAARRVTLTDAAFRTAEIRTAPVTVETSPDPVALEVPGHVEFDPRRVAVVSARIAGRLERLGVVEGDHVRAGQAVAWLYSPAHVTAQHDYQQAQRRAERLVGTIDEEGARALAAAARQRLSLMGVASAELDRLASGGEPSTLLAIRPPFRGSIMESHVLPGAAIEPGQPIFTLADLSVIDVVASVPERSLPLVRVEQRASVAIPAYPDMRFDGRVERLRDQLDPDTRTIEAVIHVSNAKQHLRPGMYATVRLAADAGAAIAVRTGGRAADSLLTIPQAAVVTDGNERLTFVEVGPRTFERRVIEITSLTPPGSAEATERRVAVQSGLVAGERVVVNGAFTLKSELAKAGLDHGH
jgi:RND family efflux transporter MFP subunit